MESLTAAQLEALKLQLAQGQEGPSVSPSVPYVKYIMIDEEKAPPGLPPELVAVIYDREQSLTFLTRQQQEWYLHQTMRGENLFKQGRPALVNDHRGEITLACSLGKVALKLSRSTVSDNQPILNERTLQGTQMTVKTVDTGGGGVSPIKRKWYHFGRKAEGVKK